MSIPAIVLADGTFATADAKVAHGLVRGSDRFRVLAVIDRDTAGRDAGEVVDARRRGIPVLPDIATALRTLPTSPTHAILGAATHGGRFTAEIRAELLTAVEAGLSVVNGLHDLASDDERLAAAAERRGVDLIDVRRHPPTSELRFWHGAVLGLRAPRIAVLGTDCAVGKRTTTRLLTAALNDAGIRAAMIYTGQTGWMQGAPFGLILDSLPNDFVCGELERALIDCERELQPDVMVIEGQASLRNPSGPCGSELLVAGRSRGVVLQHAVGREFHEGFEHLGLRIPSLSDEIDLIRHYGATTVAVTLHGAEASSKELLAEQARLREELEIPVVRVLEEGLGELVPAIARHVAEQRSEHPDSTPPP